MCDEYLQSNQYSFNGTEARIGRTILGIHTLCKSFAWSHLREYGTWNGNHKQNIEWSDQLQVASLRQSIIKQKKLEHHMRLHENRDLFSDALQYVHQLHVIKDAEIIGKYSDASWVLKW